MRGYSSFSIPHDLRRRNIENEHIVRIPDLLRDAYERIQSNPPIMPFLVGTRVENASSSGGTGQPVVKSHVGTSLRKV